MSNSFSFVFQLCEGRYQIGNGTETHGNGYQGTPNETLIIPSYHGTNKIIEIAQYAFSRCYSTKVLIIEEGIEILGISSFRDMHSLVYALLPSTLTEIQHNCFDDCFNLETVLINQPSKLEIIQIAAFSTCKKLKSFFIPNSVKEIQYHTFAEIQTNLKIFYCGNRIFNDDIFKDTTSVEIFVPKNGVPSLGNRSSTYGIASCDFTIKGTCDKSSSYRILTNFIPFILIKS